MGERGQRAGERENRDGGGRKEKKENKSFSGWLTRKTNASLCWSESRHLTNRMSCLSRAHINTKHGQNHTESSPHLTREASENLQH